MADEGVGGWPFLGVEDVIGLEVEEMGVRLSVSNLIRDIDVSTAPGLVLCPTGLEVFGLAAGFELEELVRCILSAGRRKVSASEGLRLVG